MEKVDAAYLEEIVKSGGHNTTDGPDGEKKRGKNDVKIEEMNTTIEEILEQAHYLGKQRSKRETTLHTNRYDPNGHSRKLFVKIRNTEMKRRSPTQQQQLPSKAVQSLKNNKEIKSRSARSMIRCL